MRVIRITGANLYSNADAVDAITVEQYNKFLVRLRYTKGLS